MNPAHEAAPYVTATIGAHGGAVLVRANEETAGATVGWGRTSPRRVFEVAAKEEMLEAVSAAVRLMVHGDGPR
ncbi:hypothetical protein ABT352_00390 [Streptosporangium sp. NPDC000563]|uniref:hypothetical protein n=1 Tax=unclassified Streptosporangium TaxID=2632669 RepID=UPI00331B7D18